MIIHLTGPDTYRSSQRLRELRQAFITKHDPQSLNTVMLDGDTMTPETVRNVVTSTGFFSTKRFVAIDRYSPDGPVSSEQLVELTKIAAEKESDVIIVVRDLMTARRKTRSTTKIKGTTAAKKKSVDSPALLKEKLENFPVLQESQMLDWILQIVKSHQATIAPAAASRLVVMCNRDTWRLASEIEKLVAHAGGAIISVTDVEQLVKSEASSDIFALTDALGHRQNARVLELLHRELASGTNEFSLIATLASHIRNLYHVKAAQGRGLAPVAIAAELDLHPFVVQKATAQATKFSDAELRDLHHRLLLIDHDLKTSPLDAETLFDMMAIRR